MIDLFFDLDAREWVASLGAFPGHAEDTVTAAVLRSAEAIAEYARANHPYTNRTGDLERETRVDAVSGTFLGDTLHCAAIGGMIYGSFVEDRGYAFLPPAAEAQMGAMRDLLGDAVTRAVERSDLA